MEEPGYIGRKTYKCRICNSEGSYKTYKAKEMMQETYHEFEYFVCDMCNCLQIGTIPDDLGNYYGDNYYSYEFNPKEEKFETAITNNLSILDVGCGSGSWLYERAKKGYGNLYGCDPFITSDISYGDRVHIYKKSIHEMEGEYDIIRMSDSFEHVMDPHEVLDSAYKLLKPDGTIYMTIPFFPNAAFDVFGVNWYQLDAPRHIQLLSKESIAYLCVKHGFTVDKLEYDSNNSQFIRSFLYQEGIPYNKHEEYFEKYYMAEDVAEMDKASEEANKNAKGDHVKIFLKKL